MGRQIKIAATATDERMFLTFLSGSADIAIMEAFSPTSGGVFVEAFAQATEGHWVYYIWNRLFPWQPELAQVASGASERSGAWYVANVNAAPVVEFARSDVPSRRYGRIYWAKQFASPEPLRYDAVAFEKWFNMIARWVRKHGTRVSDGPYFLPDALIVHQGAQPPRPADRILPAASRPSIPDG